jgi:hypothetical protein
MNHIFRWNGQPLGFVHNNHLFDSASKYLGWVEPNGTVWLSNGSYVGDLVEGSYILRNSMKMQPMPKMPKVPPMPPMAPMSPMPRMPKMPRMGWIDPFDQEK